MIVIVFYYQTIDIWPGLTPILDYLSDAGIWYSTILVSSSAENKQQTSSWETVKYATVHSLSRFVVLITHNIILCLFVMDLRRRSFRQGTSVSVVPELPTLTYTRRTGVLEVLIFVSSDVLTLNVVLMSSQSPNLASEQGKIGPVFGIK